MPVAVPTGSTVLKFWYGSLPSYRSLGVGRLRCSEVLSACAHTRQLRRAVRQQPAPSSGGCVRGLVARRALPRSVLARSSAGGRLRSIESFDEVLCRHALPLPVLFRDGMYLPKRLWAR